VKKHNNFTLIELLVVLVILAILISLLLPSFRRAKRKVQLTQCLSNMRQLNILGHIYTVDNKQWLPAATDSSQGITGSWWMVEMNPNWNNYGDIDVRGTVFECSLFKSVIRPYAPDQKYRTHMGWQIPYLGGIGWNRYASWDTTLSNYPRRKITQIALPSETLMLADTKNDDRGSGGSQMQLNSLGPAWGQPQNMVIRHYGKLATSWMDGHQEVLKTDEYHSGNFDWYYMNPNNK